MITRFLSQLKLTCW